MTFFGKISLLSACLSLCLSAVVVSKGIDFFQNDPAKELYSVVSDQFDALSRSNFEEAYVQTSQAIKVKYDVNEFTGLLRSHYHPLFSAERVELGSVSYESQAASVQAYLVDRRGVVTPCVYHLVKERTVWRISGVVIQPTWPNDFRLGGIRA